MQKQEPNTKFLIQFWIDVSYQEQLRETPDYHRGLISHLARKGFLKELEAYLLNQQTNEPETLAS
jgi:hypothetical protein